MPLGGDQLTIKEALALCHVVGFRKDNLVLAVAVMSAESGRYTGAWHDNTDGSEDRGLFQLNSKAQPSVSEDDAYDPLKNAEYTFQLSKEGTDWHYWAAFNSGAHEKFITGIQLVKDESQWQSRKKLWL